MTFLAYVYTLFSTSSRTRLDLKICRLFYRLSVSVCDTFIVILMTSMAGFTFIVPVTGFSQGYLWTMKMAFPPNPCKCLRDTMIYSKIKYFIIN